MVKTTLVLSSKSPRRRTLVQELGFPVEIRTIDVDEVYPDDLAPEQVPAYLAELKAAPLKGGLAEHEILITSDTIVILNGEVIGKPANAKEAISMLKKLSGKEHKVISGVALHSATHKYVFSSITSVFFDSLNEAEIDHYVETFSPLDKAGSYGIQEWIGYIGVQRIEGCYYNVMGLPLHDLYQALKNEFNLEF